MGKFINTQYKQTVDSISSFSTDLLNNNLYKFNDKKPTKVRYWNINKDMSTLDQGSKLAMDEIGDQSPLRFNQIDDLFMFGLPRIELNLENGDYGLEAEEISGECFIMPNIIEPIPGDFFQIDYIPEGYLFKVTGVDRDTIVTGSTVWKIAYKLDRVSDTEIKKNVVKEFIALDVQQGTNYKCIVEKKEYLKAVELDELGSRLKKYYIDLFFKDSVQTFIYKYLNESNMYDPFLIEFMIRNGILINSSSKYTHVEHQTPLSNTFAIDYDRTFYKAFEDRSIKELSSSVYVSQAKFIDSMITVFHSMFDAYFELDYKPVVGIAPGPFNARDYIEVFPQDLVYAISDNTEIFEEGKLYQNIFIKYFNGKDIDKKDLENINNIKYDNAKEIFYMLPLIIFVLEYYTKKLLS
jgi:hypothetical protein